MLLACQNISKSFGETRILSDISFHIEEKEKIAIVGINGCGKTTLLKLIVGEERADEGQIVLAKDTTIGYLSQQQEISYDNTVYEQMLETKKHILTLEDDIRRLELEMQHAEGDELARILEIYHRLSSKYDRENGYAYESEVNGVLKGLGFAPSDYDQPVRTLSGGQKMRVALGSLLLTRPDIIILDEPTNHLDTASTAWLENFLASYAGSVIIVSHDRYFIDKIATKIVEIDQCKGTVYHGNYTYYAKKRLEIRESKMKAYLNQQQEIRHQEAVITKLKQFNREKSIKRAESREKMLNKIELLEKPTEADSEMRLTLTPSSESGNDVLTVRNLSKSFGENSLFSNLDFEIKRGEHVALIGGNGTGKTTILKMINRLEQKDEGQILLGSRVKIGYYDQEQHLLSPQKTIFEELSDSYPELTNTRIRNVLAAFLFTGEEVFKKIGELSGGEKGRVSLAKLMLSPANFLILDEPTNHLDIQSKEILEEALKSYTGTVLFVSHDRYFINTVSTRILELKEKKLFSFIGNYDYYLAHREILYGKSKKELPFAPVNPDVQKKQGSSSGKEEYQKSKEEQARLRKQANDIRRTEEKIEETEKKINEIDEQINRPENATNSLKLGELSKEKEALETKLLELYSLWDELSS